VRGDGRRGNRLHRGDTLNWFGRQFRSLVRRAAKYAGIPLRDPALVAMLGSQPSASGVDVDENTALTYSAVWQAITLISSNVAALPPVPQQKQGDSWQEAAGHPAYSLLLESPNDEMTPFVFHETLQAHALGWGNAYARIERESEEAPPLALHVLPPNQTVPERNEETGEIQYRFTAMQPEETSELLEPWEVLHIPGIGFDGLKGYSVIQQARETIGLGLATEKFGAAFFGRGCTPGGLLTYPEELELTEKAKKNLRESFELLHRGPDNAHRIAILDQGMGYQPLALVSPEDAQFLQTRAFQIVEIARWFNIPPHLLRDLSMATFSNIEHQGIDFLVYTLRPWLLRWAQEYRRKLFRPAERKRYRVVHETHNLLLTDTNARYQAYNTGRNGGWLTLNDIMRGEGRNPLPAEIGDTHLAPSTMKVLGSKDPSTPIDPAVLRETITLIGTLKPIPAATAIELLKAALPMASDVLVAGVIAQLDPESEPLSQGQPNDLRATVGGATQLTAMQTAYYTQQLPREAVLGAAIAVFGFTPEEANTLFPQVPDFKPPQAAPPAARVKDAEGHDHDEDGKFGSGGGKKPGLVGAVAKKVTGFVKQQYADLEKDFGRKGAIAILATCVAASFVPAPGTTFAPIALAKAVKKMVSK
jgi:HK97 family phage portal protein